MYDHEEKARGQHLCNGPVIMNLINYEKSETEKPKKTKGEKTEERHHYRRNGLPAEGYECAWGRVTFPHDTTSGGGASRVSARDLPERDERTNKTITYN